MNKRKDCLHSSFCSDHLPPGSHSDRRKLDQLRLHGFIRTKMMKIASSLLRRGVVFGCAQRSLAPVLFFLEAQAVRMTPAVEVPVQQQTSGSSAAARGPAPPASSYSSTTAASASLSSLEDLQTPGSGLRFRGPRRAVVDQAMTEPIASARDSEGQSGGSEDVVDVVDNVGSFGDVVDLHLDVDSRSTIPVVQGREGSADIAEPSAPMEVADDAPNTPDEMSVVPEEQAEDLNFQQPPPQMCMGLNNLTKLEDFRGEVQELLERLDAEYNPPGEEMFEGAATGMTPDQIAGDSCMRGMRTGVAVGALAGSLIVHVLPFTPMGHCARCCAFVTCGLMGSVCNYQTKAGIRERAARLLGTVDHARDSEAWRVDAKERLERLLLHIDRADMIRRHAAGGRGAAGGEGTLNRGSGRRQLRAKNDGKEVGPANGTNLSCVVCMAAPRSQLLLPCRHVAVCEKCCANLKSTCPICRANFTQTTEVFCA